MSRLCHLEVKDAGIVVIEALVSGDDSGHHVLVQRQRGDGRQQPAVTWTDMKTLRSFSIEGPHPANVKTERGITALFYFKGKGTDVNRKFPVNQTVFFNNGQLWTS